jgi:hypothetical protein
LANTAPQLAQDKYLL